VNKLPKAKSHNILVQEASNEVLIYNTENNEVYCLNETAAFIWQNCDGTKTISEIKLMNNQLNDDLIFLTLDLLKQKDLLDKTSESYFPTESIDRRKMFAKYGALAVALPLITSIVAPIAVHAQSSCVNDRDFTDSTAGICIPVGDLTRCMRLHPLTCCPGFSPFWQCTGTNETCFGGCRAA
jgi:hypothetical protein